MRPSTVAAVFRAITRTAVICVLCLSLGGHWIALQSVAWGSMLVHYSQRASLAEAVAQTFDGAHPCNLCKAITAAQREQKKHDSAPRTIKPDLICATRVLCLQPPARDVEFSTPAVAVPSRVPLPPTPPPRSELA